MAVVATVMFRAGDLVTGVATSASTNRYDFIDDGTINVDDISAWLSLAATKKGYFNSYLRGDTELDRDVDITDFNALANHFDSTGDGDPQNGPFWNEGNFDGDDDVDITDFNFLASNFAPDGYGASNAIPEPSSFILCVFGILAVSRFVSRREVG